MPEFVFDGLLATMSTDVHSFALCRVQRGWRLAKQGFADAYLIHFILKGQGEIIVSGQQPIAFQPYSLIIPPKGVSHTIGFENAVNTVAASEDLATLDNGIVTMSAGDGSDDILFACGVITANYAGDLGLFNQLKNALVEDLSDFGRLKHAFAFILEEMASPAAGTKEVTGALMKQCLLLLLRTHLERKGDASPMFGNLKDPKIAKAIVAVLEAPGMSHSVESLSKLCGMSRTAFAKRFSDTFGQGPMEFLHQARLRLAAHLLTTTQLPVKVIAMRVGYSSRSYFSNAFRADLGTDPTTYRKDSIAAARGT